MNVPALIISVAGAACIAVGLWTLVVRPEPPAGTSGATTVRGRQIAAIFAIVLGIFALAVKASQIFSGAI